MSTKLQRVRFLNRCKYILEGIIETEIRNKNEYDFIADILDYKFSKFGRGENKKGGKRSIQYIADFENLEIKFKIF